MNLSVIERLAREGDLSLSALKYLLECKGECEWLDFKEVLKLENERDLCGFTKDILGIKNVGGGYIVIGVKDKTWVPTGIDRNLPFDSKMLRDKIRACSGVDLDVDIVSHEFPHKGSNRVFALILVRSSRKKSKRRVPTMAQKDFCPNQPFGIRRGDIYVRRGDATVKIDSEAELLEIIETLESNADQDSMQAASLASPFSIEHGTFRLLEKGFEKFIGREKLRQEIFSAVTRDPRIWIINVHGPGGVGKSALVNWAVYEFYEKGTFEAILHLTAKETVLTPSGIRRYSRSLFSLENLLDHVLEIFDESIACELAEKKKKAIEFLSAWRTLLVLDNMETVSDNRILDFIQNLPNGILTKIVITSRQKTGGWEQPLPISELSVDETREFVRIKAGEMGISIPDKIETSKLIWSSSGGLPLAVQWIIGKYKLSGRLDEVLMELGKRDSPVLEFSFGTTWNRLTQEAKAVLAVMTIFDDPPTVNQIAIACEYGIESIEKALAELQESTLVTKVTQMSDGRATFVALPITIQFARHQMSAMGDFEISCRQRFQKYTDQMRLHEAELHKFRNKFEKYGLSSDNEKRAAILCQKGISEMFIGNTDRADMYFREAREAAPQSSYVLAMCASYELQLQRIGAALEHAQDACRRANKLTGSLCYTTLARIYDAQKVKVERVDALEKAIEYEPEDLLTRHQYGVALSRVGFPEKAIDQFTFIIEREKQRGVTQNSLVALKTRIINFKRIKKDDLAKLDLDYASNLITSHPGLAGYAREFKEFTEGLV